MLHIMCFWLGLYLADEEGSGLRGNSRRGTGTDWGGSYVARVPNVGESSGSGRCRRYGELCS